MDDSLAVDRTFFVQSTNRRIRYQSIPDPTDSRYHHMAYDVTETPASHAEPGDTAVGDLVELDNYRAEMGLVRLNLVEQAFNRLWRAFGADKLVAAKPGPAKRRELRLGHPDRHVGGFGVFQ